MLVIRCFLLIFLTFLCIEDLVLSLTTTDKIISYGYPIEVYQLQTEDGALLGMERIPHGKRFNGTIGKPVILMCPLLSSSIPYVITNISMAFSLADAGFDVWLSNYRAMGISNKMRHLSQMNWNYSIHELGIYDFPATVDFVLKHTNFSKVDVVGVSMGAGITLIGLSERPEYNAKIRKILMIAPAARNGHMLSIKPYRRLIINYPVINVIADFVRTYPQPVSSKYVVHVFQSVISGRFQKYDYGPYGNLKHYNSSIVPEYNITKVTAPSIIIYSKDDIVTSPSDIKWLLNNLPNMKDSYFIQMEPFSHQGLIVGKRAHIVVYPYMIKKLLEED
ncbi:gastric triacylglycerol lipase-like isoform X2 [Daktulosphaira vitifoliae]|uniref:gastric triacylglycerol lipase-like isoform X2 n=1 Tax=Daktulosphaira vitifoliae TaxID=58002 RepID=UPI0021AABD02|nr:gastric triacylglycerol lipase-like isoform X2 [Daktulosphaira vitifoliae]